MTCSAMNIAQTEGKDPDEHKMSWQGRQQKASTTKDLRRFEKDKDADSPAYMFVDYENSQCSAFYVFQKTINIHFRVFGIITFATFQFCHV